MQKADAQEAAGIVQRMMTRLAATVAPKGLQGSQARTAISDVRAHAYVLLRADQLGPPLDRAFVLAREAGATRAQIEGVRVSVAAETPRTLGAILVQNCGIEECLATEAEIIAAMTFVSRQDVDALKTAMRQPFQDAIEISADEMDQATFQTELALFAAVTNHLVQTARPLPRLIPYQFSRVYSTLVLAQRLYADPSRADEIRDENKIVHPLFCPHAGLALSA